MGEGRDYKEMRKGECGTEVEREAKGDGDRDTEKKILKQRQTQRDRRP